MVYTKKIIIFLMCFPAVSYAQSVPRLNHTLPQYQKDQTEKQNRISVVTAPTGQPSISLVRMEKNLPISGLYTDGSAGTLLQVARMADNSVQQIDIGTTVAGLTNGAITAPVWGDISNASFMPAGSKTARMLLAHMADRYNLADLGAKLDGSPQDSLNIERIYHSLPSSAVVEVPKNSKWNGVIDHSDPNKRITWIFLGKKEGLYSPPVGDNDLTISYEGSSFGAKKRSLNTGKGSFVYPAATLFWNDNPHFDGVYAGNYQQYSSLMMDAISGPMAKGNTGGGSIHVRSYGMNASDSYDTGVDINIEKFGQNATWGSIIDMTDYTGRLPQAFSQWNEIDILSNGYDVEPWDRDYQKSTGGHRIGTLYGFKTLPQSEWKPNNWIDSKSKEQNTLRSASVISVLSLDNKKYTWYGCQGGKTGTQKPLFPPPAEFTANILNGKLIVTSINKGVVQVGDYLSASGILEELQITGQISGERGGRGVYSVSSPDFSSQASGFYAAPHIRDGSAVWAFGADYDQTVSAAIWVTGDSTVNTAFGTETRIANAVLDASNATLLRDAAVVRMGPNQTIDFSANRTVSGRNQHTLSYSDSNRTIDFKVATKSVLSIDDSGNLKVVGAISSLGGLGSHLYTPPSSASECAEGQFSDDKNYHYVCVSNNHWRRVALHDF